MNTECFTKGKKSIEEELHRINSTLIPNHQFKEALQELLLLAKEHMDNAQLWMLVGHVYTRMAFWTNAIGALETAILLNHELHSAKRLLAFALFSMGRKKEACKLIDKVVKNSSESGDWILRAYIHAHTDSDPIRALEVARDWGKRFADPITRRSKKIYVKDRNPLKKLKVGYVTADFREHSVAFFMQPILEFHNVDEVDVYVYSNGPEDEVTDRLRGLVPHWSNVMELSDDDLYQKIRQDDIDVLVDLSGFTHGHRLEVFARRAAPVQVTWLGYMLPLGMKAMDYRIVSRGIAPASHAKFYSEKLAILNGMSCYMPPHYSPLCEEPPIKRNGYPTLISMNSSGKITDEMLAVWAEILKIRSDAKLIIVVKELTPEAAHEHMLPRVTKAGMPLERVSVMPQQPLNNFMELGYIADVALDTSPISGGTTTLHTLWMGLPIVALNAVRGVDSSTARILTSNLKKCGFVAEDEKSYIDAVLNFMNSIELLSEIRMDSRRLMRCSGLMNYAARTRDIERAYRLMWICNLSGKKEMIDFRNEKEYQSIFLSKIKEMKSE